MAANVKPIFGLVPNVGPLNVLVKTADNVYDGNGANTATVFTAGSNGAYVERVRFRAAGTNVATVVRVWLNNGGAYTTASNNELWDELTLPITTASAVAATVLQEIAIGIAIPAGYRFAVGLGTTVAAGYYCTAAGTDY